MYVINNNNTNGQCFIGNVLVQAQDTWTREINER